MQTVASTKADVTIDLSGLTCPAPLLGAKRMMDDLQSGQVLALLSDCPGTRDDLFIWAKQTDNEVVEVDESRAPHRVYYIRKGRRPKAQADVTLDMTGLSCPGPIVEARKILDGMKPGQVMKLVSSCPASRDDVKSWTQATGNKLLDTREPAPGIWEFFIQRG